LQHPLLTIEFMHADAAAAALVEHPEHFDVIVCENFIGDILSDLGAATVGGLGTCPSANVGDGVAYFEPVHGSAPDLIAQDPLAERADPTAQILAGAMLLDYLGEHHASGRLRAAVRDARAAVMRSECGSELVLTPLTNEVIARLSQTD
jgi:3-isopropylmalate dehydrogenase